jgi:DNA-binding FadR family transcriptional regulator
MSRHQGEAVDFQEAKRLKSDPERQANCHEKVAQAIFYGDKQQAREATYQSMQEFWQNGAGKEEQKWDKDTISLAERF